MHLIATCLRERLRLVSAMGAAARLDPTKVRVGDLSETRLDPFARELRKLLKKKHDIDCTRPVGVTAIYSQETPIEPHVLAYDTDGFECVCPSGDNGQHDCDHRNRVDGSAAFVPSVFGMTAASVAVRLLTGHAV
jgi:tRNA A37 threonylcarbamoyladenosine dehydratase